MEYYVAVDGGGKRNGFPDQTASWAYCVIDKSDMNKDNFEDHVMLEDSGRLPGTNNIGELTALKKAFEAIYAEALEGEFIVVYDSMYAVNCITKWYPNWVNNGTLSEKKNTSLIKEVYEIYNLIKSESKINFVHIKSHKKCGTDNEKEWLLNKKVDEMCQLQLYGKITY